MHGSLNECLSLPPQVCRILFVSPKLWIRLAGGRDPSFLGLPPFKAFVPGFPKLALADRKARFNRVHVFALDLQFVTVFSRLAQKQ